MSKPIQFTAVFRKVPEGYIGFVEELPGANTQGETLDETRRNLEEAITWSSKLIGPWPKRIWPAKKSSASRSPLPHETAGPDPTS